MELLCDRVCFGSGSVLQSLKANMLRVTFHCADESALQSVVRALSVLAVPNEQQGTKDAFSIYNANTQGDTPAIGVELVEIHNEEHNTFSSSLGEVCLSSLARVPLATRAHGLSTCVTYQVKHMLRRALQVPRAANAALTLGVLGRSLSSRWLQMKNLGIARLNCTTACMWMLYRSTVPRLLRVKVTRNIWAALTPHSENAGG